MGLEGNGMKWGWVNDGKIFIFRVNFPNDIIHNDIILCNFGGKASVSISDEDIP